MSENTARHGSKSSTARDTRTDKEAQRTDPHGFDGLYLLCDGHCSQFRSVSGADTGRHHDACHEWSQFSREGNRNEGRHQPFLTEGLQLVASEQRHR